MASPGQLIDTVANVFQIERTKVANVYRVLREAKLVTISGRGRSAAKVTPRDAGRVILGVGGTDSVKAASAVAVHYGELQSTHSTFRILLDRETGHEKRDVRPGGTWGLNSLKIPLIQALPPQHTLLDAVAAIIQTTEGNSLLDDKFTGFEVLLEWPKPKASIVFRSVGYSEKMEYHHRLWVKAGLEDDEEEIVQAVTLFEQQFQEGDLTILRHFSHKTLVSLGELLRS